MANTNQTYYNRKATDFKGMFDAGQAFTPVDWSQITTDLMADMQKESERRVQKKKDIQDKTDSLLTDLRDYQAGGDQTFNGYVLDGSNQVKNYMLMQNKLMKQGKLDPNAYVRSNQLLQDDWNAFQTAAQTFNEDYAAALEAAESGDLSALGELSFNKYQNATDIQNSRLVINTDGRLYSQTSEGELVGFTHINARQKDLPMNWDVQAEVKTGFTDNIGKTVKAFGRMTIESALQSQEFLNAEKTYIDGVIGSKDSPSGTGRDFLSILTKHHGYTLTEDPAKAKGKTILVKADSNGRIQADPDSLYTAENIKLAKGTIQDAIRGQLNYVEKAGGTYSDAMWLYDKKTDDIVVKGGDVYSLVAGLSSPDANTAQSSLDTLAQQFTGIESVKNIVDEGGRNKGIEIIVAKGAQPVPIMFETPQGTQKTRRQITKELFPLFFAEKLSTQQFDAIEKRFMEGEGGEGWNTSTYQTPLIEDSTESYNLKFNRPAEIPRVSLTSLKIAGKDLSTAASDQTTAINDTLENEDLSDTEKKNEIKKLNKAWMQELEPLLTYQTKEGDTESIDLEVDATGSIITNVDGKTYTVVDALTGNVNINVLQGIIDRKQAPPRTFTNRAKGRFSVFNSGTG